MMHPLLSIPVPSLKKIAARFVWVTCWTLAVSNHQIWAQEQLPVEIKLNKNGLDEASRKGVQFSDPQKVRLTAKDRFELAATFYPGVLGKNTPPVILLHDLLGSSDDLIDLATFLRTTFGYAVLVPDLRGHGKSKKTGTVEIDAEKFGRDDFNALMMDVEACKKFLITRNDDAELNIDLLSVVAVGKSCVTAVNWALGDWSYPTLAGLRQGQDVKALVLISPEQSFKGVRMNNSLKAGLFTGKDFDKPLRVLLAAGKDNPAAIKEVDAIATVIERNRPTKATAEGESIDGVYVLTEYDSNGAELTKAAAGDLQLFIAQLIYFEIYRKQDSFPWAQRAKK